MKCQHCNKSILGRIDKRFCNDYCKNTYHNRLNKVNGVHIRSINKLLLQNRKILEEIVKMEGIDSKVHKKDLLNQGFNFEYHTHILKTKNGDKAIFCYEYGLIPNDTQWYSLLTEFSVNKSL